MRYVIGVDLGTSSVKVLLVNQNGEVVAEATEDYPLIIQKKSGYSEQNPEEWVEKTLKALKSLMIKSEVDPVEIDGLSFSGQMHGLVLLDETGEVLRPAILWNDTRTTDECRLIVDKLGDRLLEITKNRALEGFTLPKLLWVKQYEPDIYENTDAFVLPKDYLRYRLTGNLTMEISDAAGTLMLDISERKWSSEVLEKMGIREAICPPLIDSHEFELENEQGPGLGAGMLAAYGCGWFNSLEKCYETFTEIVGEYNPSPEIAASYEELFYVYKSVYQQTKVLNQQFVKG
jgi:xylulokinase